MASKDTLLIRHLPAELNEEEKKDLLYHFGAVRVKVMRGSMKNCAFATFSHEEETKKALVRLHQLKVFDRDLVAEYARTSQKDHFPKYIDDEKKLIKDDKRKKENILEIKPQVDETYQKWGIPYCANPQLHYQYPPPTMSVIANIANALASYPKFYVQVLHLMNKLHLPVPFGNLTQAPPIPYDVDPQSSENMQAAETSSQEESELESDEEQSSKNVQTLEPTLKRPHKKKVKRDWKRMKLALPETMKLPTSLPAYSASDVFETNPLQQKKINFKLPDAVPETTEEGQQLPVSESNIDTDENMTDESDPIGFGKIVPTEKVPLQPDTSETKQFKSLQFVSADEIKQGRISTEEMVELPAFKNYSAGEPSSRLYIKNLSKHVSEEDLWKIFGYYVDWNNKEEKNMFYIRLMQEGRIRGQAFITLPNEEVAKVALEDTNGFVLHSRPMVVQFARSAKQKEESNK